jgi:outer membrane protein OmpA-like peptidoglycan-associated protein
VIHRFPLQRAVPLLALLATACIGTRELARQLESTEELIEKTRKLNGPACAPVAFANAEADAAFARIEFLQGNPRRALTHTEAATAAATEAYDASASCGGQDYDGDGLADVVDRCPKEPEDIDGDRDEDGCRDLDPYADQDGDGLRNIDDSCVDDPEDFDGHNDGDGCPETSEDNDGDGLIDALDGCAGEAEDLDGFKDGDGCPDPDNDNDLVPDNRDACPNAAEDIDDWDDEDGCPDPDNDDDGIADAADRCPNQAGVAETQGCPAVDEDGDGVADANDRCPNEAETNNGYLDDDGCADVSNSRVRLTRTQIELIEPLRFEGSSATLTADSLAVLSDAVKVLQDVPALKIEIGGHTDSQGEEAELLSLSTLRAQTVLAYLVDRGIARDRLTAVGYGATRPVDTNRTERGREANRRIELLIAGAQ